MTRICRLRLALRRSKLWAGPDVQARNAAFHVALGSCNRRLAGWTCGAGALSETSQLAEPLTRDQVVAELTGPGQSHELEPVLVGVATARAFKNAPKSC